MAGLGNFMVILPMIFIVNKIDFTEEMNALALRIIFCVVHLTILAIVGLIYQKIKASNDQTPVPSGVDGQPDTTVAAHDMEQLMKYIKQICITLCIIGFIHFKMGSFPPLAIQSVMNPMNLYKNKVFKLYILGSRDEELLKRPWVEESPFSAMAQPEAEAEETAAEPAEQTMDVLEAKKSKKAKKED